MGVVVVLCIIKKFYVQVFELLSHDASMLFNIYEVEEGGWFFTRNSSFISLGNLRALNYSKDLDHLAAV